MAPSKWRLTRVLALLALTAGGWACGAIASFSGIDAQHSGVAVVPSQVPADGVAATTVRVQIRYSKVAVAQNVTVAITTHGSTATVHTPTGRTDAAGIFETKITAEEPGIVYITASLPDVAGAPTLVGQVEFLSVAAGVTMTVPGQASVAAPFTVTVTLVDKAGQQVQFYDGTIGFSSSDPLAVLPAPYAYTQADRGQHDFNTVVLNSLGAQTITVTDAANASFTATSAPITLSLAGVPHFAVSGATRGLAGASNHVQVQVLDNAGRVLREYKGTVQFTSSDPQAVLPNSTTFTAADAGVKTLPVTLKTAGVQFITAQDATNLAIFGMQDDIVVDVLADRLAVDANAMNPTAGEIISVVVRAIDGFGNTDPNYCGTVSLGSSDVQATLPAHYQFVMADAGAHALPVILGTAGEQNVLAQSVPPGLVGQVQVAVTGGDVQRLGVGVPVQVTAGVPFDANVVGYDRYNNIASSYIASLSIASTDLNALVPMSAPIVAGTATLQQVELLTAGRSAITAADSNRHFTAQGWVTVASADAARFVVTGATSGSAGHANRVTVAALDAFGNLAAGYTGTVVLTSSDPNASLPTPTAFTLADAGSHDFLQVALNTAGVQTIHAQDSNQPTVYGTQGNVLVTGAAATRLIVSTSQVALAGAPQQATVSAIDAYGNVDTNYTHTVTWTSSDPAAVLPTPIAMDPNSAGESTAMVAFATAGNQTLTVTDGQGLTATLHNIAVSPQDVGKFLVTGIADGIAGRTNTMQVQAVDNYNNLIATYTGSVAFSSSDALAVLPSFATFSLADGGQRTFACSLHTAGAQSVTVVDTGQIDITGSQNNIIVGVQADRLQVVAPTVLQAGAPFTLRVAGVDAFGNVDPNYVGHIGVSTTSTASTLPTSIDVGVGMQGVVVSPNVALLGVGVNLQISAQDAAHGFTGNQGGISVTPAAASGFRVRAPAVATVDQSFSASFTAIDPYGNQATAYTGTIRLSSSDSAATMPAPVTFTVGDAGNVNVTGFVWQTVSANAVLRATDTTHSTITGNQNHIFVQAGGATALVVTGATSGPAGHVDNVQVVAVDNSNNIAVDYTGTVRLSSTDPLAVLPASYQFTLADQGQHTFAVQQFTSGSQTMTATDVQILGVNGAQSVVITALNANTLALSANTITVTAGVAQNIVLSAHDVYGNVDTQFNGSITFASTDGAASLPAPLTLTNIDAGTRVLGIRFATVGLQSVTATGPAGLTGTLAMQE